MQENKKGILIIGCEGSMGKRYQAILKWLRIPYVGIDQFHTADYVQKTLSESSRIILCTPTENHFSYLEKLIPIGNPILCEKPISKSLNEINKIFKLVEKYKVDFSMTFQYSELVPPNQEPGDSHYNYFRSGKDGIFWDCLQIIALAKGAIAISNESPAWSCMINNQRLFLGDMDSAYLSFVRKWTNGLIKQDLDHLYRIHEKTDHLSRKAKL